MKKAALILSVIISLTLSALLFAGEQPAKELGSHLGTWQLVSAKYGDATEFSDAPKDTKHLKMLTETRFVWVRYDVKTKVLADSMGGSYSLQDGKYTETVEFCFPESMKTYLGKKQEFTIKIDGDKLTQSGKLSDGMKIEEVWQRVK
jgi:hypothetical protein